MYFPWNNPDRRSPSGAGGLSRKVSYAKLHLEVKPSRHETCSIENKVAYDSLPVSGST